MSKPSAKSAGTVVHDARGPAMRQPQPLSEADGVAFASPPLALEPAAAPGAPPFAVAEPENPPVCAGVPPVAVLPPAALGAPPFDAMLPPAADGAPPAPATLAEPPAP